MFNLHHKNKKNNLQEASDPFTGQKKSNVIGLFSLCIFTFSLGIGWYIPGGIANPLIATFNNVFESNVNLTLTLYMIGVILAGLIIPLFLYKVNRKYILVWSALIFCIGDIIIGVSINFSMLLVFRFITGLCHGSMFAIGTVVAASLVPKNKKGSAVAICFTTLFVATFTLVPLFTYTSSIGLPSKGALSFTPAFLNSYHKLPIYHQYWRWVFFVDAMIAAVSVFLMQFFISKNIPLQGGQKNPWKQLSILLYYPFDLAMIFGCLVFMAIFLIYPLLQKEWRADEVGIIANAPQYLALLLAGYGLTTTCGNQFGGRFTNGKTFPNIYYLMIGLVVILICLTICVNAKSPIAIFIFTICIPICGYTVIPNTFAIGMSLGRYHDKTDAVDLESGISDFMLAGGGMVGSAIGGPICTHHTGELAGRYNPNNFIIVCVIAIALCTVSILFILPVHWYMHNNELVNKKYKFYNKLINCLPFVYDQYASSQVIANANEIRKNNPHRKVIEIKPLFHRKVS